MSEVESDLKRLFQQILNERWICRTCGFMVRYAPERSPTIGELRTQPRAFLVVIPCPYCHSTDWERRTDNSREDE